MLRISTALVLADLSPARCEEMEFHGVGETRARYLENACSRSRFSFSRCLARSALVLTDIRLGTDVDVRRQLGFRKLGLATSVGGDAFLAI